MLLIVHSKNKDPSKSVMTRIPHTYSRNFFRHFGVKNFVEMGVASVTRCYKVLQSVTMFLSCRIYTILIPVHKSAEFGRLQGASRGFKGLQQSYT